MSGIIIHNNDEEKVMTIRSEMVFKADNRIVKNFEKYITRVQWRSTSHFASPDKIKLDSGCITYEIKDGSFNETSSEFLKLETIIKTILLFRVGDPVYSEKNFKNQERFKIPGGIEISLYYFLDIPAYYHQLTGEIIKEFKNHSAPPSIHKCHCDIQTLWNGCKCGGI